MEENYNYIYCQDEDDLFEDDEDGDEKKYDAEEDDNEEDYHLEAWLLFVAL